MFSVLKWFCISFFVCPIALSVSGAGVAVSRVLPVVARKIAAVSVGDKQSEWRFARGRRVPVLSAASCRKIDSDLYKPDKVAKLLLVNYISNQ